MLRQSFIATSVISAINFTLTEIFLVQALLIICLLASLAIALIWPEPSPPPPSSDPRSEAPDEKERELKICSP